MSDDKDDLTRIKAEWKNLYEAMIYRPMKIEQAMVDFDKELEELINGADNDSD
jgi:hypothetical protein